MAVHLFASAKGAPGVTTSILALAAGWPNTREPFVVEADPAGGDVVARLAAIDGAADGLRDAPSLVHLAAASRHGLTAMTLLEHAQRLPGPGEVRVLVGPSSSFAATTALAELVAADLHGHLLSMTGVDVLVDLGSLHAGSPVLPIVRAARSVTLVVRPVLDGIVHARDLASSLAGHGARAKILVVGDRPYAPIDVAAAVGAELVGVLPHDPIGAAALAGDARNPKILGRSRLVRTAALLAEDLTGNGDPVLAPTFEAHR